MAEQSFSIESGFFDSMNDDRVYTANDMNRPYRRLISEGVFATPLGTPSTDLQTVSAQSGMNIIVKKGEGLLANKWFESANDIQITVASNSNVVPRRDSVILQMNTKQSGRIAKIIYREGTPSSNPQPPALSVDPSIVERRLANIYVAASANYIGNDAIVDLRGSSECPWITSLIYQVDTSQLYNQWQSAYQQYYDNTTSEFNDWMDGEEEEFVEWFDNIKETLATSTLIRSYSSVYTTTGASETEIPINISQYNQNLDILQVYINGLRLSPIVDYSIDSNSQITLTLPVGANTPISFEVFKSIDGSDAETVVSQVNALENDVNALKTDTGWIDFWLESGATAYDTDSKPAVRKFGNQVFIRGAIKGLNTLNTPICTLPPTCVPSKPHYYSAVVGSIVCTLKISTDVRIVAKSGEIQTTDLLPIATSYIVG